ncbi:MAG TPA: T9SS type A sorting domain-containing protein [Bacteroidia bacterium]|nr:T9SS type A sorting domain-containing protein [Bacteroidia bacterium]
MKKIYSLLSMVIIASLSFSGKVEAQITLSSADMPAIGNKFVNDHDTATASVSKLTPGGSGASVNWTYNNLPTSYRDTMAFVNPASTPYVAAFPSATLADSTYGTVGYTYFNGTGSSFSVAGTVQSIQGNLAVAALNPPFLQLNFPAAMGNISGGTSTAHVPAFKIAYLGFDSAKATVVIKYQDTIDAWGTLETSFYNSSYSVLRQKHYELDIDSAYVHSASSGWAYFPLASSATKAFQYRWYTNGIGDLVGVMAMDTANKNVKSMQWYAGYPDAINEVSQQHSTMTYPNPCTSQVTFRYTMNGASTLFVYDVTGREIGHAEMKNGLVSLNTSAYSTGMYLYHITDNSGKVLDNGKFSVIQ